MKLYLNTSHLYIIAFSHKKLPLSLIGQLYLSVESPAYQQFLEKIKTYFSASEIMHISTCNRCEFYIVTQNILTKERVKNFIDEFYAHLPVEHITKLKEKYLFKKDEQAVKYLMEVTSSLQSMVVGEREIITQIRNAYEHCKNLNLTGDLLRLVIKKVIETGKEVFTKTDISKNPVSVASLAVRSLRNQNIPEDARVTVIGSGVTIHTFMKYFHQKNYQYTFVSRKKENSHALQTKYGGCYMSIDEMVNETHIPTDILVVCTAAPYPVINLDMFEKCFANHSNPVIVDLSNPSDVHQDVFQQFQFKYIDIQSLKRQAKENLIKRKQSILDAKKIIQSHLEEFMHIYKERCIENNIKEIPVLFKEYKQRALNEIFKKRIEQLNEEQKSLVEELMNYVEEKYNAVTYKKLKSILLQ